MDGSFVFELTPIGCMSSAVRLCFARNFALAASSLQRAYDALSVLALASGVPAGGHRFGRVLSVADAAATALGRRGFWVPMGLLSIACWGSDSSEWDGVEDGCSDCILNSYGFRAAGWDQCGCLLWVLEYEAG